MKPRLLFIFIVVVSSMPIFAVPPEDGEVESKVESADPDPDWTKKKSQGRPKKHSSVPLMAEESPWMKLGKSSFFGQKKYHCSSLEEGPKKYEFDAILDLMLKPDGFSADFHFKAVNPEPGLSERALAYAELNMSNHVDSRNEWRGSWGFISGNGSEFLQLHHSTDLTEQIFTFQSFSPEYFIFSEEKIFKNESPRSFWQLQCTYQGS